MGIHFRNWAGAAVLCLLFALTAVPGFTADRAIEDEADLEYWLLNADGGDRLLLTPTPPPDFLQLYPSGTLSAGKDNLTLDGNVVNGDSGYIIGNDTFHLLDFTGYTLGSVVNIEINDGHAAAGDYAGAITADAMNGDIRNAAFRRNVSESSIGGGAIYIDGDLTGNIRDNVHFDSNTASGGLGSSMGSGGGMYIGQDFLGFIDGTGGDVHFDSNTAELDGGGMFVSTNFGGGSGDAYIYATYFANNTARDGSGGGLYVGRDFIGDLRAYSFFDRNTAGAHGGGMFVGVTFTGDIMGARFTNNEAGRSGGGLWVMGMEGSIGGGTTFENNKAGENGGALYFAGLGLGPGSPSMLGNISASFIGNSAGLDGGAVSFGGAMDSTMAGGFFDSIFTGNSAGNDGGALHVSGNLEGDIARTTFTDNTAGNNGGALNITGFVGTITDTSFTGNSADGDGGGIYFDTSRTASEGFDVIFAATAGNTTSFSGNTAGGAANSFYVSGNSEYDFIMEIGGEGTVAFYDPFQAAMDNGFTFSMIHNAPAATLVMSGTNLIQAEGGTATMHFLQGTTQVLSNSPTSSDFTTIFQGDTTVDIRFGSGHTLAIINMADRDNNTALFDLTGVTTGGSNTLIIESGTTLDITRLLKPLENNRYLLVSGLDPSDNVQVGEFSYLHPDGYTKVPVFENNDTEIWLDDIVVRDAFDPNYADPNVVRGENCLTAWLNGTAAGLALTSDQVLALRADFASAVPEAAVSLAVISLDVHTAAAGTANQHAFGIASGSWGGFETAGAAAANPAAEAGSIIAGWNPVSSQSREALAGSETAYAQVSPFGRSPYGMRLWSGYMGSYSRTKQLNGYSGYDADTHGFLTGLVWDRNECVSAGIYGGYSRTKTDFRDINAKAKTNSYHFGGHTAVTTGWGLRTVFDASYTHASNKLNRTPGGLGTVSGKARQDIVSMGVSAAYDIYVSPKTRISPLGTFSGAWLRQGAFDESGPVLASHVKKFSKTTFFSVLGASVAHDFVFGCNAVFTPSLSAGWKHNYGADNFAARYYFLDTVSGGTAPRGCVVESRERGRNSALIGAAADALFNTAGGTQWGVKAAYNLEAGRKRTTHNMFVGAELRF